MIGRGVRKRGVGGPPFDLNLREQLCHFQLCDSLFKHSYAIQRHAGKAGDPTSETGAKEGASCLAISSHSSSPTDYGIPVLRATRPHP